ncbi:MAG: hypothetical protein HZB42_03550 [Sphingobacteriales bacterium]|nr:hypothetical protein [Sphingobacteriales bacterium]
MKSLLKIAIISAFVISMVQSCVRTDCANGELYFSLVGFTDHESDSIILRRFSKGNNFNLPLDSALLNIGFKRSHDTLNISYRLVNMQITSGYDFEFYFPVAGKTYRLTEITEEKSEQKKSLFNNTKEMCINPITHLKINGAIAYPNTANHFYLTK